MKKLNSKPSVWLQREPVATVGFIDDYCQAYRPWFALVFQPYLCWGALEFWLEVLAIPALKRGLFKLMDFMDQFHILPELRVEAA